MSWKWQEEEKILVLHLQPSRFFYKLPDDCGYIFGLDTLRRRGLPQSESKMMPEGDYLADFPEVTAVANEFVDVWMAFRYMGPKGSLSREIYKEAM